MSSGNCGDVGGNAAWKPSGKAGVSIRGRDFILGCDVTYPSSAKARGRLMNVRMINCIFEDRNPQTCPEGFDPEANADAFIVSIPQYRDHGVLAFTIGLQGGFPGYEGAVCTAFEEDGTLRDKYFARAARVIRACDGLGMAVILSLFYQRQDQVLENEDAVLNAVLNAVNRVASEGFTNVLIEIANEYPIQGFTHRILQSAEGEAELINLAREAQPRLLYSASGLGNSLMDREVAEASDFITLHGNGSTVETMSEKTAEYLDYGKPVIFNEDAKYGREAADACEAVFNAGGSWGYMNNELNQYHPFHWGIEAGDDETVYDKVKELTT